MSRDVIVSGRDNALVSFHNRYQFDGRRYRLAEQTVENMDTGETKPAHRPSRAGSRGSRGQALRGTEEARQRAKNGRGDAPRDA